MPIFGNSADAQIAAPDYDQIALGSSTALVDSIRLIWNTLQATNTSQNQQRFAWRDVAQGTPVFRAPSGTWSQPGGSIYSYKYVVVNDVLILMWYFSPTTTTGTLTNQLYLTIPNGYNVVDETHAGGTPYNSMGFTESSAIEPYCIFTHGAPDLNTIILERVGANWPVSSILSFTGTCILQIQT